MFERRNQVNWTGFGEIITFQVQNVKICQIYQIRHIHHTCLGTPGAVGFFQMEAEMVKSMTHFRKWWCKTA